MGDQKQIKKPKRQTTGKRAASTEQPEQLSKKKQQQLDELDKYIEGVLETAGEDFLDQFKQVEGQ